MDNSAVNEPDAADEPSQSETPPRTDGCGRCNKSIRFEAIIATLLREKAPYQTQSFSQIREMKLQLGMDPGGEDKFRGTKVEKDSPPEKPYTCKLHCLTCFDQFYPAYQSIDDDLASETTRQLADSIGSDFGYLRRCLSHRADLIVSRWKKKSKDKRLLILREIADLTPMRWAPVHFMNMHYMDDEMKMLVAQSMLPLSVKPPKKEDIPGFVQLHKDMTIGGSQDTWLTPYLDAATLAEDPLRFLGLLHARTAFDPEHWVMFDKWHLILAELNAVLIPEFNKNCVIIQRPDYGKLVPWEKEKSHQWQIVGYCKARRILTAQKRILRFLRKTVQSLLGNEGKSNVVHIVSMDTPVQVKWEQLVRNNFFSFGNSSAITTSSYLHQPFSFPPVFDPARSLHIIINGHRSASDELYQLQTDPRYVQHLVQELEVTAYFGLTDKQDRWRHYYNDIMNNAIQREWRWRRTHEECELAVMCHEAWKVCPSAENTWNFYAQIYWLWEICAQTLAHNVVLLDKCLPFHRGFERNFTLCQAHTDSGKCVPEIDFKDSFYEDKLFWSLSSLGHDEFRRRHSQDPCLNFQVLDHHLSKADFEEKSRLNGGLLKQVSDLAVLDEVRLSINLDRRYRPESRAIFNEHMPDRLYDHSIAVCHWDTEAIGESCAPILESLCTNFRFPTGKMDNLWLRQASAARDELGRLWQTARTKARDQLTDMSLLEPEFITKQIDVLSADRSEEHIEERRLEELAVQEAIEKEAAMKAQEALKVATTPIQTTWGNEDIENNIPRKVIKTAAKLSKLALTEEQQPTIQKALPVQPRHQPEPHHIKVEKSSYNVLTHMFPSPGEVLKKSFKWNHFVDAMTDADSSTEQGSGSAVCFRSNDSLGSVSFHRPHPEPVIDPIMLNSMAKRMRKWFGWSRDIFEVREKGEKGHRVTVG